MGIFQDNFSMLSELERLAAMVQDPVRVQEIGADQWPLAMMACALMTSNDPSRLEDNLIAYRIFASKTPAASRKASLTQLTRFITARKGEGWRAFLPYALMEPEAAISRKAAMLIATLAQPEDAAPLRGVAELVQLLVQRETAPTTLLDALLSLSDMRVLPLLSPLSEMPAEELAARINALQVTANRLSCSWLVSLPAQDATLAQPVADALCRMVVGVSVIIDLTLPIPSWAFQNPAPQPLHGWTPAEYFARMKSELSPVLSADQLAAVQAAYGA